MTTGYFEVFVQVVDVLDDILSAADTQVVEHGEVLDVLAQADTAGVRADGDFVLGGDEEDGEDLIHTSHTTRVDLTDVHRAGHDKLHTPLQQPQNRYGEKWESTGRVGVLAQRRKLVACAV